MGDPQDSYILEHFIKMDDLEVPPFKETSICLKQITDPASTKSWFLQLFATHATHMDECFARHNRDAWSFSTLMSRFHWGWTSTTGRVAGLCRVCQRVGGLSLSNGSSYFTIMVYHWHSLDGQAILQQLVLGFLGIAQPSKSGADRNDAVCVPLRWTAKTNGNFGDMKQW